MESNVTHPCLPSNEAIGNDDTILNSTINELTIVILLNSLIVL